MSETIALILQYRTASLELGECIDNLRDELISLRHSSEDKLFLLKHDLATKLKNWQQTLEQYQLTLQAFPKELKKRPTLRESFSKIEGFDQNFKKFSQALSQFSIKEELEQSLIQFQRKVDHLKHEVELFEAHPLVQKFLRGETILSSRKTIQWGRKIGHMLFGVFFLYLFVYSGLPKILTWSLTGAFLVWAFSLEIARHFSPRVNDWVCKHFRSVMREAEKTRVNSAIFYIVAMLAVYFLFPIEVTIVTMLFVALGDSVAGIVGVKFGRTKIFNGVSLEGSLACFAACFVSSFVSVGYLVGHALSGFHLALFSFLAGLVGALSESSFKKLDDNLMIPLLSAPSLWLLMKVFGVI